MEALIVVADASPLHYLILVRETDILPKLFSRALVPAAVSIELTQPNMPSDVREWMARPPEWLEVHSVRRDSPVLGKLPGTLGAGEREAIALAEDVGSKLVLADDRAARNQARARGLRVQGTLGVLRAAGGRGLMDVARVVVALRATNFRASEHMFRWAIGTDA